MSMTVTWSWSPTTVPPDLAEWVVYAARDRDSKGAEVARVPGGDRFASWVSTEDLLWVRVLAVLRSGSEEPWEAVEPQEVFVQGRTDTAEPDTPSAPTVAHVDQFTSARVTVDAPAPSDPPAFVQVIQGADEYVGKLVAETKVLPAGPIGTDGPPQHVSLPLPLEGYGGTKDLTVRHMGQAGRPGPGTTQTVREPDDAPPFHEVAVCSWSGTTRVNVPAASATTAHEFDATDGARARAKPTCAGATGGASGWGTAASGLLASAPVHGAYLPTIEVESDEVDLGSSVTFRLTTKDTVGRKSAAGTLRPVWATKVPAVPAAHQDVRLLPEGVAWAMRETRADGKPRQPLRSWRWEYVVGTSSPVAHGDSDYKPVTPGMLLRGRYLRVRLVVTDPTGQHQIICPSATVTALVYRRTVVGTGSPESVVAAPPGSHFTRTDGPPHHYVKATGLGNTGWLATNAGGGGGGGGDFMADGSVPATGDFDMDGHKITDAAAGSAGSDLATVAQIPGGVVVTKSSNYTVVTSDRGTLFRVDCSGGAVALTLPTAPAEGFIVSFVKTAGSAANACTLQIGGGSDTIEGPNGASGSSLVLARYESVTVAYDTATSKWVVMAHVAVGDGPAASATLRTLGTSGTTAAAGNDSRFPTSGEKDALAGTSGAPSSSNKFVTDADSRMSDTRAPTAASVVEASLSDAVWTAIYLGM